MKIKCPICGKQLNVKIPEMAVIHRQTVDNHEIQYWMEVSEDDPISQAYNLSVTSSWNGGNVPLINQKFEPLTHEKDIEHRTVEIADDEDCIVYVVYCPSEIKDTVKMDKG